MKAFLIDPWTKEITEVQIPADPEKQSLAIYLQLSHKLADWVVEQFEAVRVSFPTLDLYLLVDEELLAKPVPPSFRFDGVGLIWGKALVVGLSKEGFISPPCTSLFLSSHTRF